MHERQQLLAYLCNVAPEPRQGLIIYMDGSPAAAINVADDGAPFVSTWPTFSLGISRASTPQ
jgi:hypothetical protein